MKIRRLGAIIGRGCLIAALATLASCNKNRPSARVAKPTLSATPKPTPHLYKLGEPRPIVLNVDKPIIVKSAATTPSPKPGDRN
jgi:hypothetical protein